MFNFQEKEGINIDCIFKDDNKMNEGNLNIKNDLKNDLKKIRNKNLT